MRIEGNTIIFKSTPENFYKEKSGHKSNTIRRICLWSEMKDFEDYYIRFLNNIPLNTRFIIKIINSTSLQEFTRRITDITEFEGLFIISWKHEE